MVFHGQAYWYDRCGRDGRRPIGVLQGLGGDVWIVGWLGAGGGRHRLKSPRLEPCSDERALQQVLDAWAAEKALAVAPVEEWPPDLRAAAVEAVPAAEAAAPTAAPADLVLARAETGVIPRDLDGCARLMALCERAERTAFNVRWMTIARAKELCATPSEWIAWVMAHYPQYGRKEAIHHTHQVGAFLLAWAGRCDARITPPNGDAHSTPGDGDARITHFDVRSALFSMGFNQLFPLSRLPQNLVLPFFEKEQRLHGIPVAQMSRTLLRARVAHWLREPAPGAPERRRPVQGDFLDALFAASADDRVRDRYVADGSLTAPKSACGGLVLLDIGLAKYEAADEPPLPEIEALLSDLERHQTRAQALLARASRRLLKA